MSKCTGCNKQNIPLFAWLSGQNYCTECTTPKHDFIREYILEKNKGIKKEKIKNKPQSFEFYVSYMVVVLIFCAFVLGIFSISGGDNTGSNGDTGSCFQDYSRPGAVDCY